MRVKKKADTTKVLQNQPDAINNTLERLVKKYGIPKHIIIDAGENHLSKM